MSKEQIISKLSGTAVPIPGDEIDTDRIVPARCLKEITFEKMGDFLFVDACTDTNGNKTDFPLNQDQYQNASMMLAGWNFGCGSSREHAPQAVKRWGIKFLVGKSFAEIFAGNCKALGMPAVTAGEAAIDELAKYIEENPATEFSLDLEALTLTYADKSLSVEIAPERRKAFLTGSWDAAAMLAANEDKVKARAAELPHMAL